MGRDGVRLPRLREEERPGVADTRFTRHAVGGEEVGSVDQEGGEEGEPRHVAVALPTGERLQTLALVRVRVVEEPVERPWRAGERVDRARVERMLVLHVDEVADEGEPDRRPARSGGAGPGGEPAR